MHPTTKKIKLNKTKFPHLFSQLLKLAIFLDVVAETLTQKA